MSLKSDRARRAARAGPPTRQQQIPQHMLVKCIREDESIAFSNSQRFRKGDIVSVTPAPEEWLSDPPFDSDNPYQGQNKALLMVRNIPQAPGWFYNFQGEIARANEEADQDATVIDKRDWFLDIQSLPPPLEDSLDYPYYHQITWGQFQSNAVYSRGLGRYLGGGDFPAGRGPNR